MIFGESKPLGEEDVTFVNPDGSALTDGQNLLKMINGKKVSTDLTYTLPDHEITLKFKKDILNKHFQSLGQSEMTPVEKIMSKMNLHTSTDGDSQQNFNTMGIAPVSSERQRATDIQVYENI